MEYNNSGTWAAVVNGTPAVRLYQCKYCNTRYFRNYFSRIYQYRSIITLQQYCNSTSNAGTLTVSVTPVSPLQLWSSHMCRYNRNNNCYDTNSTDISYSIDGTTYTNTTGVFALLPAGSYTVTARNSSDVVSPAASVTLNGFLALRQHR